MTLAVLGRALEAQGMRVYIEPATRGVRGSFYYDGTAAGICRVIERVYDVGYYWRGDRVYFGGRPGTEWVRLNIGSTDVKKARRELKGILPRGSSVGVLGSDLIVSTNPAQAKALRNTSLVSSRDYKVSVWMVAVDRRWWAGIEGSLKVKGAGDLIGQNINYTALLDAALSGGYKKARIVDMMSLVVPGGQWGQIRMTDDRFFETFDIVGESGEKVRSGFEKRAAGLELRVLVRREQDKVGLRYEVEKSRFREQSSKRVNSMSGSVRISIGQPAMVARIEQSDIATDGGLTSGLLSDSTYRDILLIAQVE